MDNIKEILFKKHFIREIIILFFIVLSLLFLSVYTSFALFEITIEKTTFASIVASEIDLTLSTTDDKEQTSTKYITVAAGETITQELTITNNSEIETRYKLYFKKTNIPDTVTIAISDESKYSESEILKSKSSNKNKKTVKLEIDNKSSNSITVTIGVRAGYATNPTVTLNTNENEFQKLENIRTVLIANGVNKYPDTIGAFNVNIKRTQGIQEIKYIYDYYDEETHTVDNVRNLTTLTTYCSNSDNDTTNDCSSDNNIELDVLETGYNGCTEDITEKINFNCLITGTTDNRKGYAEETLDNKSYIFYIKDSLNQESIYLVTVKVKLERTGIELHNGQFISCILKDNQIITGEQVTSSNANTVKIYNILSSREFVIPYTYYGGNLGENIKCTTDYIYYTVDSNGIQLYYKAPRYGGNVEETTEYYYENAKTDESLLYTVNDNPIEHPILGNTSEKLKMAFYKYGLSVNENISAPNNNEECNYGKYENGVLNSFSGTNSQHSELSNLIYKSQNELEDKYVFFNSCEDSASNSGTCFTYFETKPEVVVDKIK